MSIQGGDDRDARRGAESILLRCEPTTEHGRDACVRTLLTENPPQLNLLVVTYQQSPRTVLEAWRHRVGDPPAELQVVSADPSRGLGSEQGCHGQDGASTPPTIALSDPGDLTELGLTIQQCLREWQENSNRTAICGGSLTAMSQWVRRPVLIRFLRQFLHDRAEVQVHFHISPESQRGLLDDLGEVFDRVVDPRDHQDGDDRSSDISKAVLFDLLRHPRRRRLLDVLLDTPGGMTLDALVERLDQNAPLAAGGSRESPARERRRVRVSLLHKHLPKLSDAGVIEYDDESGTVRLVGDAGTLERYLDRQHPRPGEH